MSDSNPASNPGIISIDELVAMLRNGLAIAIVGVLVYNFLIFNLAYTLESVYSLIRYDRLPFMSYVVVQSNNYYLLHVITILIASIGIYHLVYHRKPRSLMIGMYSLTILFLFALIASYCIQLPIYYLIITA